MSNETVRRLNSILDSYDRRQKQSNEPPIVKTKSDSFLETFSKCVDSTIEPALDEIVEIVSRKKHRCVVEKQTGLITIKLVSTEFHAHPTLSFIAGPNDGRVRVSGANRRGFNDRRLLGVTDISSDLVKDEVIIFFEESIN